MPASFDEAARELTLQAAAKAGYPPVVLLEEPQAAFYAWIDARGATAAITRGSPPAIACWCSTSAAAPPTSR